MAESDESCRKNAEAARAEAERATLPNVRARALEAAAKWAAMASRMECFEEQTRLRIDAVNKRVSTRKVDATMTDDPSEPVFTARGYKASLGWYVWVEWPDGRTYSVDDFGSEIEALQWIENDSVAWLASRP